MSKGVYSGRNLIANWKGDGYARATERDAVTGMGSIIEVFEKLQARQLVVTKVLQPDMLADYLKRTYMSPSNLIATKER